MPFGVHRLLDGGFVASRGHGYPIGVRHVLNSRLGCLATSAL